MTHSEKKFPVHNGPYQLIIEIQMQISLRRSFSRQSYLICFFLLPPVNTGISYGRSFSYSNKYNCQRVVVHTGIVIWRKKFIFIDLCFQTQDPKKGIQILDPGVHVCITYQDQQHSLQLKPERNR
jgi:hypothetical protein